MTNRQWLLNKMQNISDEEFINIADVRNIYIDCDNTDCKGVTCTECTTNWLKSEHKEQIKLSDAERVILENIDKEFKWISRDKDDNQLFIYTVKPIKNEIKKNWGAEGDNADLELFNHLFQFIKWEDTEPYKIEELLKQN